MPNSKDIAAVPEAEELVRESAQITFGLHKGAVEKKRHREERARDARRNPDDQPPKPAYKPIGFVGKGSERAAKDPVREKFSRRPGVVGDKLHEINQAMGTKDSKGYYRSSTESFSTVSLSGKNITFTRKGEKEPAFKRVNGKTTVNNLSKSEVAKVHKAHSKVVGKSKDKGAGRGA